MKKHAVGLLKYGIGFGLLGYVIYKYRRDLAALAEKPVDPGPLVLAAVLMAVAVSLQMGRWFLLVRALDLPFTLRNAFRLGLVGIFYNTFLPGSVGGDVLKAYFIAKEQPGRKAAAVATVLIDRAMGLFGLILFAAVCGGVAWAAGDPRLTDNPDLQWIVKVCAGLAGAAVVGYLLLGFLPERRVDRFAGRLQYIPKLGRPLAEMWYAVWVYRQRPKTVAVGVAVSALSHICLVFAFHFAAHGFTFDEAAAPATLPEHMVICPIGFIVQALPLAPGGVGVGEAAFAGLYKLSGRAEGTGVAARLSLRVVEWTIGLIGYVFYLRMRTELPVPEAEEAQAAGDRLPPELAGDDLNPTHDSRPIPHPPVRTPFGEGGR